jgi:hypothetical protein
MGKQWFVKIAILVMIFSACALSQAKAEYTYFDDFNTQLDPYWWTMSSSGSVTASYVTDITNTSNKLISMKYVSGSGGYLPGEGNLKFNFPVQGNFSASILFNLYNWPKPDNDVTAGIRTDLGDVERLNNGTEFYLTDFVGDYTRSKATEDMSGRLRIIRNGTVVQGAYYDETINGTNKWVLIGQYNSVSPNDTNITISLWPGVNANQNVTVVFDDFNFHAYDATSPKVVPEPVSCMLFGFGGLTLLAARKGRKKNK